MTEQEDTIAEPEDPGASSDGEGGGVQIGSETERRDNFPSKERWQKEEGRWLKRRSQQSLQRNLKTGYLIFFFMIS